MLVELSVDALEALLADILDRKLEAIKPHTPAQVPDFLSRKEAADYLRISLATLDKLSRNGVLRKVYLGGTPRFRGADIAKVLDGWERGGKRRIS